MKVFQHIVVVFSIILLFTNVIFAIRRQASIGDWILVYNRDSHEVSALYLDTQQSIQLTVLSGFDAEYLWVSPNRQWLYFFDHEKTVWARNFPTGETRKLFVGIFRPYEISNYFSQDGRVMIYDDNNSIKRFDFNTATETLIDTHLIEEHSGKYPRFRWVNGNEWVYLYWNDVPQYRINRDGTMIQPYDNSHLSTSPDGEWIWDWEDDNTFIINLVDQNRFLIPSVGGRTMYLTWTPENALIVRYHDDYSGLTTIKKFQDATWTTLAENVLANEYGHVPYRSISPKSLSPLNTHYFFSDSDQNNFILDFSTEQATYIDQTRGSHMWNETGEWLMYTKTEDPDQISIHVYDVINGTNVELYTLTKSNYFVAIQPLSGTDYVLQVWEEVASLGAILMNVKTGSIVKLDPEIDVNTKWDPPTFPPPHYGVLALIELLLVGVPVATKVTRRKLSA